MLAERKNIFFCRVLGEMVDSPLNIYRESELFASLGVVEPSRVAVTSSLVRPTYTALYIPQVTFETSIQRTHLIQLKIQEEGPAPIETYNIEVFGFQSPAANVGPGAELSYTLALRNREEIAIDDLKIVNAVPPGFKVSRLSSWKNFVSDSTGEVVTFSGSGLQAGEFAVFRIVGIVPQGAIETIENVVTVEKSFHSPVTITTNIDPNLGPDLRLFGINVLQASAGDTITYTLGARNDGLTTATDIEVRDTLPSGFNVSSVTTEKDFASSGLADANNVLTFSGGTLKPGEMATLTIEGTISTTATDKISNVAAIDPDNRITEKTESNNIAIIDTNIIGDNEGFPVLFDGGQFSSNEQSNPDDMGTTSPIQNLP